MDWVERWQLTHGEGQLRSGDAELGAQLGRAFHATRRDALASAAFLRLVSVRDLPNVLEGLSRVADPTAPHAKLASATLKHLPALPELREELEKACERWQSAPTDPHAELPIEEALSKSAALESLVRRASSNAAFKDELQAAILTRLKTGAAPLRRSMLHWIERLATHGIALDVVKPVEKLAKPTSGQAAREALASLAGLLPTLEIGTAMELVAGGQSHLLPYWHARRSLEALGKAGQLGSAVARVTELHPAAAELELIAKNDAATYFVVRERAELNAFVRHVARLQLADETAQLPQLFPSLANRDLDEHGGLWPRTQELCFYLGPTQLLGERATAWLSSRASDDGPPGWPSAWRGWATKNSRGEVAIRALGHASAHPQANAAREALVSLLTAPLPASAHAARALSISAAARSDWALLERLLSDKKSELREAALLGLATNDANYARDMREKPWGSLALGVPSALLAPLSKDRSKAVAELAARLLTLQGRPTGEIPNKTIDEVIAGLRSGNYTQAEAAQRRLTGLVASCPLEVLARFVAPLADSLEACSSAGKPIRALLDARVDLRELWPALAGAYFANPAGSPLEILPFAADGAQAALFDPLIEPFLTHVELATHLLAHFLRYAERRCLAGHALLRDVPPALYASDDYAALCINALGPQHWPSQVGAT